MVVDVIRREAETNFGMGNGAAGVMKPLAVNIETVLRGIGNWRYEHSTTLRCGCRPPVRSELGRGSDLDMYPGGQSGAPHFLN